MKKLFFILSIFSVSSNFCMEKFKPIKDEPDQYSQPVSNTAERVSHQSPNGTPHKSPNLTPRSPNSSTQQGELPLVCNAQIELEKQLSKGVCQPGGNNLHNMWEQEAPEVLDKLRQQEERQRKKREDQAKMHRRNKTFAGVALHQHERFKSEGHLLHVPGQKGLERTILHIGTAVTLASSSFTQSFPASKHVLQNHVSMSLGQSSRNSADSKHRTESLTTKGSWANASPYTSPLQQPAPAKAQTGHRASLSEIHLPSAAGSPKAGQKMQVQASPSHTTQSNISQPAVQTALQTNLNAQSLQPQVVITVNVINQAPAQQSSWCAKWCPSWCCCNKRNRT
jgi:hypothetical protein